MSDAENNPDGVDRAELRRKLADVLKARYGEAAVSIAMRQAVAATGEGRATWNAICGLLRES